MRTERQKIKHVRRHTALVRYEVDRFLSGACCHQHAFEVWSGWQQVLHLESILDTGKMPDGAVNMAFIVSLMATASELADTVEQRLDGQALINGWALNDIAAKSKEGENVMHVFVRVPLLPPGKRSSVNVRKKEEQTWSMPRPKGAQ